MDHRISPEVRPDAKHRPYAGHVSGMIESEGQRAVITGDIATIHANGPSRVAQATTATVKLRRPLARAVCRMGRSADSGHGTHYAAPTAGHVKRDGEVFRFDVLA